MSRNDSDNCIYPPEIRDALDAIDKKIAAYNDEIEKLERTQVDLKCGISPIKPGDLINWEKRNKQYRGQVITVRLQGWNDKFYYRCIILSKNGKAVGHANVDDDDCPEKIGHAKLPPEYVEQLKRAKASQRRFK